MNRPSFKPRLLPLFFALGLVFNAQAQNLVDLYSAARSYDAGFQSAKAQYDANLFKAEQARALNLPKASFSAAWNFNNLESGALRTDRAYDAQTATLSGSQSLYRPADDATYLQSQKGIEQASAALRAAEQDLIMRLGQAYFDVLASTDSLEFVKAQKVAVQEQLASAKRNFEVGTATITDTREAQARFDLVLAQEIAAENDLRVKVLALGQLVGKADVKPLAVSDGLNLTNFAPQNLTQWLDEADAAHPALQQLKIALEVAKLETRKAEAGHMPTVDLVASYQAANNNGSSSSAMGYVTNATTIGVSMTIPLFAGYAIQNRVRETLSLEEKARADLDAAQRNIAQATRTAFMGLESGLGQVRAYEAAALSSQSSLDANKLGYQVGVRINIDVLNSQSQLFDTKAKLSKARYDVLMGNLRLRQASGSLKAEDLQAINAVLR
ncbi:MAG: TolC family outer membrane protein [Betaproteobacteria bacterium]